jgi:hypothetical protein
MEYIVIASTTLIVGFGLGWFACKRLAPKVGAIETKIATAEKDLTK